MLNYYKNPNESGLQTLASYVLTARLQLRSTTSSMLGVLFWEVGTLLNNQTTINQIFEYQVSENGSGSLFNTDRLKEMQQVAKRIKSETDIYRLCSITDWEHIVILTSLNDDQIFYKLLEKTIKNNWDTQELYEAVSQHANETTQVKSSGYQLDKLIKEITRKQFKDLQNNQSHNDFNKVQKNILSDEMLPDFGKLFTGQLTQSTIQEQEFYNSIDVKVKIFNHAYCIWLSQHFSTFSWQTGHILNNFIPGMESHQSNHLQLLEELSTALIKNYRIQIVPTILAALSAIEKNICNVALADYIGQHVNWEQCLALLSITDDLQKMYYARILLLRATESTSLKEIIQLYNYTLISDTEKEEFQSLLNFFTRSSSASICNSQMIFDSKDKYVPKRFNQLISSPIFELLRKI